MHRMQEVWLWSGGMYSRWWPKSTAPTLWIHIYVPVNYIISFWHRGRDVLLSISIFLKKNVLEHKRHSGQMQRGIVGRACTGLSPSIVQYAFFLFAIKPMAVWQHTEYTRISHELLLLCVNQMFCKHLALHWQPCHDIFQASFRCRFWVRKFYGQEHRKICVADLFKRTACNVNYRQMTRTKVCLNNVFVCELLSRSSHLPISAVRAGGIRPWWAHCCSSA